jgi:hypothetical protein
MPRVTTMEKTKHPVAITALIAKAHFVREAASKNNLTYEEESVEGHSDVVRFLFKPLDTESTRKLLTDVPRDAFAFQAVPDF